MSDSAHIEQQLDTIQRQAKRLSARFKLPITFAKDVLAKAFYRCANWRDLELRLKGMTAEPHLHLLAKLPYASRSQAYFAEERLSLARNLGQHILTSTNLAGVMDHVQAVFAVDTGDVQLAHLVPNMTISDWRPACIGPDPWAVIKAEARVNGTSLELVGTRTFLPRHYDFGPTHDSDAGQYAEPFDSMLKIIWAEPTAWYRAALDYLDDLEAEDIELPSVELTPEMAQHEAWFEAALRTDRHIAEYRGSEAELLPFVFRGEDCYVVFGSPASTIEETKMSMGDSIELKSDSDYFSHVVVTGKNALCLEWIAYEPATGRHPGDSDEYFEQLQGAMLRGAHPPVTRRDDGQTGLMFVRPATTVAIERELNIDFTPFNNEVALVLKTSNLALARDLIARVEIRALMAHELEGRSRYFTLFSVPLTQSELPNFDIGLVAKSAGRTLMSNLAHTIYYKRRDSDFQLLVEVAGPLMVLTDRLGRKMVDASMSHGLVQRLPAAFEDQFDKPPARCKGIPPVPEEIAKFLERTLDLNGHMSVRITQYLRDNF